MDTFLKKKQFKLSGILNGIDTDVYNPETDENIAKNYSAADFEKGKAACKKELRDIFELNDDDTPLIGIVTRLVNQKGLDLVRHVADTLVSDGMQLVILGSGDYGYENFFSDMASRRPGVFNVRLDFDPALARKIYAGADLFLMPSRFEPCGLAQMVALRYGTVPIVRQTGGLADTIQDSGDGGGNGFTFVSYNAYDMQTACFRARDGYRNRTGWNQLVKRGMACDFSWSASAKEYQNLYKETAALW